MWSWCGALSPRMSATATSRPRRRFPSPPGPRRSSPRRRRESCSGSSVAEATFRELDPAIEIERLCREGDVARARRGDARQRVGAGDSHRRAHGAELPPAAVGRRDADGSLRAGGRPERASGSSTRARRRPACEPWRRPRSLPAVARTTAPGSTTRFSSRRTTRRSPAAWGRPSGPRGPPRPDFCSRSNAVTSTRSTRPLHAGAPRILLDNMTVDELRAAVDHVAGRAELEASGGLTLETLRDVAATGLQFISVGALTHSAPALDLSLILHPLP